MKKNILNILRGTIVLLLLGIIFSCARGEEESAKQETEAAAEAAPTVFAVNTSRAVKGQIQDYINLSGDLVAGSTVDAYSDVAGKVTKLYITVGDRVGKDDPLAEVDPSRPGMDFIPGIAKAPISGTIIALPAQLGMTVTQAVPIARISASNGLELKVHVAERFISKIRVGLRAELSLDAYPGQAFRGTVKEVSPVLDPASRTMEIRLGVENSGARLKAGMFAKVKLITEEKNDVVKIPSQALVRRFGETYVFTVESDPEDPAFQLARRKNIVVGIAIDDQVEITEGLDEGDEIIVRGQTLLDNGSKVNVVDRMEF